MRMITDRELRALDTKNSILLATGRMLEKYDFKYLTVRNICEEAKAAYGSFYYHFGSKEELIHAYCKIKFEQMLQKNPLPDFIDPNDYIMVILWPINVYARFCEIMGKELINYLHSICKVDIFYECCFQECVVDPLQRAAYDGLIKETRDGQSLLNRYNEDVSILIWSVISFWATVEETRYSGRPHVIVERLVNKLLNSFQTEKYVDKILKGSIDYLLYDDYPEIIDGIMM